ncbi:MAG TPA: YaeQ family protein [Wenzhouxiangellaceae bacterium]|nr:YaeQ family protein [Wenzhouxiangellaceae bacterium]
MALTSTTHKVFLDISDTDRGVYEAVHMTVARHPSETEQRMVARILAYGLWYHEDLEFGRGLSDPDEPALRRRGLDGRTCHWIDVGRPDSDRLIWSARRCPRTSLLAYGNIEQWAEQVVHRVAGLDNLEIAVLPRQPMDALAIDLPRKIEWGLMITDGVLYVSDGDCQHELLLEWLMRRRRVADA